MDKVLIGEDVSMRLDVTPAKFHVIVTRRSRYVYRDRYGVLQAPGTHPSDRERLPTERFSPRSRWPNMPTAAALPAGSDLLSDVDLDGSLMAQWMGKVGFELQPLADYVLEKIKQGERIFADETTCQRSAPVPAYANGLAEGLCARDNRPFGGIGPPMVAYRFEECRSGECPERHLAALPESCRSTAMPPTIGSPGHRGSMRA
ncbi:transposase [Bradyrhizobium sp. CNPSo 4019]|uniref:Transposase n=1 Tax=Bradyrhizobium diversitatis TaxID=2755406 RepID=A0ABS0PBI1_9BRAD|nr:transposase [Bradyrhizobium diversitatis]